MYKAWRSNPSYLTNYHFKWMVSLMIANAALFFIMDTKPLDLLIMSGAIFLAASTNINWVMAAGAYAVVATLLMGTSTPLSLADFLWVTPIMMAVTLVISGILHNASHGNIKPKWLGRALGEFMSLIQLVGFADWAIIHVIHHSFPDDPKKDPHPPMNEGYWKFMTGMRATILKVVLGDYIARWGATPESQKQLKRLAIFSRVEQLMKVTLWWQILGTHWFTVLFVPMIVFKMLHYAWFNFATHKPAEDGYTVRNLNHSFYKVVNFFTSGLYFHGNHHKNPKLYNPSKMTEADVPTIHHQEAA